MRTLLSTKTLIISLTAMIVLFLGGTLILNHLSPNKPLWSQTPLTSLPFIFSLDITNPDDGVVVFDRKLNISGKTSPNSVVIISVEDSDLALKADSSGEFSKVVGLTRGLNQITITSFDSSGHSKQVIREVFYSEEQLWETMSAWT